MAINFVGQDLRGRSFQGQDLTGANFRAADVRGADFRRAVLRDANFSNAKVGVRSPLLMLGMAVLLLILVLISFPVSAYSRHHLMSVEMHRYGALAMVLAGGMTPLIGALLGAQLPLLLKGQYPSKRVLSFWLALSSFVLAVLSLAWTSSITDLIAVQHEASGGAHGLQLSDFPFETAMAMNLAILMAGVGLLIGTTLLKVSPVVLSRPVMGVAAIAGLFLGIVIPWPSVMVVYAYSTLIHFFGGAFLSVFWGTALGVVVMSLSQRSWMELIGWFCLVFFLAMMVKNLNPEMVVLWVVSLILWLLGLGIVIATQRTNFRGANLTNTDFTGVIVNETSFDSLK